MLEHRRYEFILRAAEPVAHASESFGNTSVLMRRKVRQPDGSFVALPIFTGDAMRHGMREAAAYALLDAAGMLNEPSLTEEALRLLFAGGMILGGGDASTIKLEDYRRMAELLPMLPLFGGCAGNRVIAGKLSVSDAVLICEEQRHLLPEWITVWLMDTGTQIDTHRAHVEEVQRVRMDPSLSPGKRLLLTDSARAKTELRLLARESAGEKDDHVEIADTKSTMMPRRFETIVQGSLFFWRVSAVCNSTLDVDTFHLALGAFLSDARIGGKRATGHGLIKPVAAQRIDLARPSENCTAIDPGELAPRVGEVFRAHVRDRAKDVATLLSSVLA